jgi:hypothetical protein
MRCSAAAGGHVIFIHTLRYNMPYAVCVCVRRSHTGHHLRYDGEKMAVRIPHDTTVSLVSKGTSYIEDDTIAICLGQAIAIQCRLSMLCHLSLRSKLIATGVRSVSN